ncbi:MAG: exonuclease SbcCD subunit D [Lachnospiraceae bacterium]|nr:exonuclease SbcCD subunit D [Lachnospiraceae bacterium]
MKFFHLSDLHIGLKLMNRDLREDQEYILQQITEIARREQPDAVVIAGDIYDKALPSAEAVEVFDRFISELTEAVPSAVIMMISGNHDSAPRVNCFRSVLSRQNLYMVGQPPRTETEYIEKVTCTDAFGKVNFYLLPFVKPSMVKGVVGVDENGNNFSYEESLRWLIARETIDQSERNVLVSHQFYLPKGVSAEEVERMDSEIPTVGNIDAIAADVLECFDYAALGHIHKPMKVGSERFRYCGTPLVCSVSEAGQEKGIVMVELGAKCIGSEGEDDENTNAGWEENGEKTSDGCIKNRKSIYESRNESRKSANDNRKDDRESAACGENLSERNRERALSGWQGEAYAEKMEKAAEVCTGNVQNGDKVGAKYRITVLPLTPLRQVRIIKGTLEEVLHQASSDYITVVLTDKTDLEVIDMQERLRLAFPNLLEIRRENVRAADYSVEGFVEEDMDPYELCCAFLKDADEAEKEILRDVIRAVQERQVG